MRRSVRPTRGVLAKAMIEVPDIGVDLAEVEHPIVVKAQALPLEVQAGKAKRVTSLVDRVWFKVKTRDWRGTGGSLKGQAPEEMVARLQQYEQWWWLCGVGNRQDDSPQHDFYERTKMRAFAGGRNTCSTDFLLPAELDLDRLDAEAALVAKRAIQRLVRAAAAESLTNSDIRGFDIGTANVRVRVRMLDDGEVYVAVGATGIADATFFALLFSSLPGVSTHDWLPEPGGPLSIEPAAGEILYSAMMTPDSQRDLLQIYAVESQADDAD